MTRQINHNFQCLDCRVDLICPKCKTPQKNTTSFGLWLRNQAWLSSRRTHGFVAHNLDYIWHNYNSGWYITIEEKTRNGNTTWSQKNLHDKIACGLKAGDEKYLGHYTIVFSGLCPDDSKRIKINNKHSSHNQFYLLLLFGFLVPENILYDNLLVENYLVKHYNEHNLKLQFNLINESPFLLTLL